MFSKSIFALALAAMAFFTACSNSERETYTITPLREPL